jgi:hypothetical protein
LAKWRTRPGYLSEEEAARESRRTEEMVKGFLKWTPTVAIGETSAFAVDFDQRDKLVLIYGKEIPRECQYKLAFKEVELSAIIDLLSKAKAFFNQH